MSNPSAFNMPAHQDVEATLRACADLHIMPYFQNLSANDVAHKGTNIHNKVTVADVKAEIYLTAELQRILPGSLVVGEEGVEDDPSLLDHLQQTERPVWVIDPIDGTGNFVAGRPIFCVMVALVYGGHVQMGWIYDIYNDRMAHGILGQGAFLNGVRHFMDHDAPLADHLGYTSSPHAPRDFESATVKTLRCTGHEYLNIFSGEALFSLYRVMKPWDHLAGALLVHEAGGITKRWDRTSYSPDHNSKGLITANNEENWEIVRDIIPHSILEKYNIEP
jgi:fructose-1,6-bisphosphatase/inositol monophosphatase family enzyme